MTATGLASCGTRDDASGQATLVEGATAFG
jgi:hypothetical protein